MSTAPASTKRAPLADAALAISFLTVIPVRVRNPNASLARAAAFFPLVGAGIGAAAGGVLVGLEPLLGMTPAAVFALIALGVLTGALHLDGLADSFDGLGARGDRGRRLAAMKDSAIGTFGVLALIGWAISLTAMLARLHPTQALLALIAAGALSRWAAIVQAVTAPPARSDGLGAGFAPTNAAVILASVTAAVVAVVAGGLVPGLIAIGLVVAVAGGCTAGALWMLGGRTGDTLGATVAIAEVAAVAALLATHS